MIGSFKTVTGVMDSGIGQFTLPGNNAGFCDAILRRTISGQPLRLESLTYVRPGERAEEGTASQQPLVVNLLMQLRAYSDQSNTFLRSQATLNLQLTNQLRQALSQSGGAVRARAGEIERAVRQNLYRSGEFQRAIDQLAKELKKNDHRDPELTVRLPGPEVTAPAVSGRSAPALHAAAPGNRTQEAPALRASAYSSGESRSAGKLAAAGPSEGRFPPLQGRRQPALDAETPQTVREAGWSGPSGPASRSGTTGPTAETPEPAPRKKTPGRKRRKTGQPAEAETAGPREPAAARRGDNPPEAALSAGRTGHRDGQRPVLAAIDRSAETAPASTRTEAAVRGSVLPSDGGSTAGAPAASGGRRAGGIPVIRIPVHTGLLTPARQDGFPLIRQAWGAAGSPERNRVFLFSQPGLRAGMQPLLPHGAPLPQEAAALSAGGIPAVPLLQRQYGEIQTESARPAGAAESSRELLQAARQARPGPGQAAAERLPAGIRRADAEERKPAAEPLPLARTAATARRPGESAQQEGPPGIPAPARQGLRWLPLQAVQAAALGEAPLRSMKEAGISAISAFVPASAVRTNMPPQSPWSYFAGSPWLEPLRFMEHHVPSQAENVNGEKPQKGGGSPPAVWSLSPAATAPALSPLERTAAFLRSRSAPAVRRTGEIAPEMAGGQPFFRGGFPDHGGMAVLEPSAWGQRLKQPQPGSEWMLLRRPAGILEGPRAGGPAGELPLNLPAAYSLRSATAGRLGTAGSAIPWMHSRADGGPGLSGAPRWTESRHRGGTFPTALALISPVPVQAEAAAGTGQAPLWRQNAAGGGLTKTGSFPRSMSLPAASMARLVQLRTAQRYQMPASLGALPEQLAPEGGLAHAGPAVRGAAPAEGPHRKGTPARRTDAGVRVIHRKPVQPAEAGAKPSPGEGSGEEILRAQSVPPAKAAALNAAYSYGAEQPSPAARAPAEALSPEAEERIASQVLRELNYNRMAAEVLDRVERRLRTERRKFGL